MMKNKKINLMLCLMSLFLLLAACDDDKSDEQLKEEDKMLDNVLQFKGYIRIISEHKSDNPDATGNRRKVYEDLSTGCLYLLDTEDGYMPMYDENGQVDGCRGILKDSKNSKDEYLKLLLEFYPDKEKSELEYMLESVFDYKNKTLDEVREILEIMKDKTKKDEK